MRIKLTSIMVDDQDRALRFYTEVLGFRKKHDIPVGETDGLPSPRRKHLTTWNSPSNRMPIPPAGRFRRRCFHKGFQSLPSK